MAHEDVFKVPDSIPPFSKRQRHISRLSEEWPFAALTDDFYDDLPYCCPIKPKIMKMSTLAPVGDFTELHLRKMSTSTPFHTRLSDSHIQDSGFSEFDVSHSFTNSCTLNTTQDSGHYSLCSELSDLDPVYQSLPRLSLEAEFDSIKSSEFDSAFESFESKAGLSDTYSQTTEFDLSVHLPPVSKNVPKLPMKSHEQNEIKCSTTEPKKLIDETFSKSVPIEDNLKQVLKQCTPKEPDRLIGKRMGREHVDIIRKLHFLNMSSVLDLVFDNVSDVDLCNMCCVSKDWNKVCHNSINSEQRLSEIAHQNQLERLLLQQENVTVRKKKRKHNLMTKGSCALGVVQAAAPPVEQMSKNNAPTNCLFWVEAAKLRNDQSLRKCPKCSNPAKCVDSVQDRAVCSKCNHDFCVKCLRSFHGASDCSLVVRKKSKADVSVGTKKSKNNLKRL